MPPDLTKPTYLEYKTGLILLIHNQSTIPYTLSTEISIQSGFETYVGISRVFKNKLGTPYSDCISTFKSSDTYVNKLFGYFKELNVTYYDQEFCFTLCYQDKLLSKCGCLDITTPTINGAFYCANDTEVTCLQEFNSYFTTTDIQSLCHCPQQCNTIEYDLKLSASTFPTYTYMYNLATNTDTSLKLPLYYNQNLSSTELMDYAKKGVLKLVINYDNLYYTSYDDSPSITPDTLFGNIGGQLGLCGGVSLMSFFEFLAILLSFILTYFDYKKKETKVLPVPNNDDTKITVEPEIKLNEFSMVSMVPSEIGFLTETETKLIVGESNEK